MAEKKVSTETIVWKGTAGIEQAHILKDSLLAAFEKADSVQLDISSLEDIDITGIQIILAAKKEATKLNKSFCLTGVIPQPILEFTEANSIHFDALLNNSIKEAK